MIQSIDHMKLNKKEGLSEDTSIPLRRGNKIITDDRGRVVPERTGDKLVKREIGSGIGGDKRKTQGAKRTNRNMQLQVQWGREPLQIPRDLACKVSRTQ